MSSTTSPTLSSRSDPPRTPLHERSNSEKNKLANGIRLVPYSPPRLDGDSAGESHGQATEHGRRDSYLATEDPSNSNPSRRKTSLAKDELDTAHPSPTLPSRASSIFSFERARETGVSGTKLGPDSSGVGPSTPTPAHIRSSFGSTMSGYNAPADAQHDARPGSSLSLKPPKSRRGNHIELNPDRKTFSIVLKPTKRNSGVTDSSLRSPPPSNYSTLTSHDGFSFDAADDDRRSSALSSLADRSVSPFTPASLVSTEPPEDHFDQPWNYHMVGGLRRVATTPDPTDKGKDKEFIPESSTTHLATLREIPSSPTPDSATLTAKPSFNSQTSEQTITTLDEHTNIQVLGKSSPPDSDSEGLPDLPSSSDSNYQVLGESSSSDSNYQVLGESSPPQFKSSKTPALLDTPASKNFIVHAGTSPASSSLPPTVRKPRPQASDDSFVLNSKYSQESLVVPPLNTLGRKPSTERFGYYRQKSRDSLRRANSFSSLSSVLTQDTNSLFPGSTPNIVLLGRTPSVSSLQQPTWALQPTTAPPTLRMEAQPQPHVWSSQLSTVQSEDESSDRGSRHLSSSSAQDRRSTGIGSRHSRQMLSISSSLAAAEELSSVSGSQSRSHSRSGSGQFVMRGGREAPQLMVRDLDEHGDGLADLQELHNKGSRPRLNQYLNHKSSDRSMRSSVSSRAGSLSASSLPQWARIYYGSGERKWLAPPSIRSYSDDSRPASSFGMTGSPIDEFPPSIFSPRRRPRDFDMDGQPISPEATQKRFSGIQRGLKKMTSSLWSPHLEEDRRAHDPSMWQGPPSFTETGVWQPRNRQVLLFALGFIFPFAWMVASFLSLPPRVTLDMVERDHSTTQFRLPSTPEPFARQPRSSDNKRYLSARWWRNLNRIMSVVGLLVIGAIIALAIVGYWQNMKSS